MNWADGVVWREIPVAVASVSSGRSVEHEEHAVLEPKVGKPADDAVEVPAVEESDVEVASDRVVLAQHGDESPWERGVVGAVFLLAGVGAGVTSVWVGGSWVQIGLGGVAVLFGLVAAGFFWSGPMVERTLAVGADGITDYVASDSISAPHRLPVAKLGGVACRSLGGDTAGRHRVEIRVEATDVEAEVYEILETADPDEARRIADAIRDVLDEPES